MPVSVRVNPDVDAKTHEKIATGKAENKFGIPIARARGVYAQAAALPGLKVIGSDMESDTILGQFLCTDGTQSLGLNICNNRIQTIGSTQDLLLLTGGSVGIGSRALRAKAQYKSVAPPNYAWY